MLKTSELTGPCIKDWWYYNYGTIVLKTGFLTDKWCFMVKWELFLYCCALYQCTSTFIHEIPIERISNIYVKVLGLVIKSHFFRLLDLISLPLCQREAVWIETYPDITVWVHLLLGVNIGVSKKYFTAWIWFEVTMGVLEWSKDTEDLYQAFCRK